MISLTTAKILFFIAMSVGPHDGHTILATSNSDNYYWTQGGHGWALRSKSLPNNKWTYCGQQQQIPADDRDYRAIIDHNWAASPLLDLSNGNQIREQGDAAFYIVDPGAPNEKVYTILHPRA